MAIPFADVLMEEGLVSKRGRNIEIGCGDGATLKVLRKKGFNVLGSDITLAGCGHMKNVMEFPAWDIPMPDKFFLGSYSTDVMEHIPPEYVDKTIKEICRVTRTLTTHQIATFKGTDHLTVKPIIWWEDQFRYWAKRNGIDYKIYERK